MSNNRLSRPAGLGEGVKVHDGSLHAPPKPDTTGSAAAARTINFGWPHRLNEAGEEKQAHRHKCFAPSIKSVRQLALQTNAENAATRWEKASAKKCSCHLYTLYTRTISKMGF